jgi:hypothetical protein
MTVDFTSLIVIVAYFLGLMAIGVWTSKKGQDLRGHAGGWRNLRSTMRWPSIWEPIFVPLSAAVCILFFGTKLHVVSQKTGYVNTIQDYFAHRYYSPRGVRGISAIIGIPRVLLIIVGVILVGPPVIQAAGGLTHINMVLATIDTNFAFVLMLTLGLSVAPHVVNNILAARDNKCTLSSPPSTWYFSSPFPRCIPPMPNFKWAPLVAFVIYVFIMYTTKIIGFASRVMVMEGTIALPTGVANPSDFSFIETAKFAFPDVFATPG